MKKLLFLIFIAFALMFSACDGGAESSACKEDKDCKFNEFCNDAGECEVNNACTRNEQCKPGEICDLGSGKCIIPFICQNEQDCYSHDNTWNPDTNPVMCVRGECKPKACKSDAECSDGKICNVSSGKCEAAQDCSLVSKVEIVTTAPVLTEGASKELKAVTYNSNGVPVNTGKEFTWQTSDENIVAVSNGTVTGGNQSGSADITASICNKTSEPLNIQNFAKLEEGKLRVIVRDIEGNRITGALVATDNAQDSTDNEGSVIFDNNENENNITVTKDGYQALTLLKVKNKDIIVYLIKKIPADKSGGFKGSFNFNDPTIINNGNLRLGFAGASLPGNILDLDFGLLLGEAVMRHIDTAGITMDLALPSGLALVIGDNDLEHNKYAATGVEGDRVLWGWGGRASLSQVLGMVQKAMQEGSENLDMGSLLAQLMPVAENFNHSIKANQNITLCPKVQDVNDINGNQDTDELISDFSSSCFPTVDLNLNQPLSQMSTFKFAPLPVIEGKKTELAILLVSAIVEGKGMVPLGLGAGTDKVDKNDTADGLINDTDIFYAPQHDGIANNDSMVVSMTMQVNKDAMDPQGDTKVEDMKVRLAGLVKYYKNGVIEDTIDMSSDNYLTLPEDAVFENGKVTFSPVSGATLYRLSIVDADDNVWLIYTPDTTVSLDNNKPIGNIKTIIVQAVTLTNDGSEVSYEDLLGFNSTNLDDLVRLITKFSVYQIDLSKK